MAETDPSQLICTNCDNQGLYADDDGHFYCLNCNSQAQDIIDRSDDIENFLQGTATYSFVHSRKIPSASSSSFPPPGPDHVGPTQPADFGGNGPKGSHFQEEDYYNTLRRRYVLGVQLLVQYQCEALVQECGVTPLICGIAGSIWLRLVDFTGIFEDDWADNVVLESEKVEKTIWLPKRPTKVPRNLYNERMVPIWCRSLKQSIPLSYSLAVSYLACHIAREPILPNDILKWAIEGKLPFFGAYPKIAESIIEIERDYQHVSVVCPVKAKFLFKPKQLSLHKLESLAATIAQSLGLSLPPVNFYRIAYRFLKQLSLPVEKIIPYACRIQEWSMPPGLWLSAKEFKLFPSRVCVMSILIVAIRILYNLNGFGRWESTLSTSDGPSSTGEKRRAGQMRKRPGGEFGEIPSSVHKFESASPELLHNLEKRYDDLNDKFEYSKDLPTYLQYCKDVVFADLEPLYKDPTLIEQLWDFYEKHREDIKPSGEFETKLSQKRSRDDDKLFSTPLKDRKKHNDEELTSSPSDASKSQLHNNSAKWDPDAEIAQQSSETCQVPTIADKGVSSSENIKDMHLKHLKIDMEEHRFCYIPPRVETRRFDYLHYERKHNRGSLAYVAHADYYILLRACAKVAQVDTRIMHYGVLTLEKRLAWTEKWINHCLMEKCSSGPIDKATDNSDVESLSFSELNL